MQKQYYLLALIFTLIAGLAVAAFPQAKADTGGGVEIYVEPHIYAGTTGPLIVKVFIDSPASWDDTADGIVAYALSVRVDPRVLEVYGARKGQPDIAHLPSGGTPAGFLENFLVTHGYTEYDPFFMEWTGETTTFYAPAEAKGTLNKTTGTMLDISEQIEGYGALGVGAGDGPIVLCELLFLPLSDVDPTVIDLFGPPRPPVIIENPMYMTVDGTWYEADVVTDGAYVAETPDTMYFEAAGYSGTGSPMGTDWHELCPTFCQWWTLESWDDNGDGKLSASDQIDLVQTDPPTGDVIWGHVEWVNPTPVAGDGQADLIIELKAVPEFPLGVAPILVLMLAIPIAYLWRRKRW
jgi:hypothetical protein